jgi:hypothetical protein
MLLSSVFPLTERSGVNLRGDFNTENITHIESSDVTIVPDVAGTQDSLATKVENMDTDDGNYWMKVQWDSKLLRMH